MLAGYQNRFSLGKKGNPSSKAEEDNSYQEIYGTVVHLDGDKTYLEKCLSKYVNCLKRTYSKYKSSL